ncbi:anaphase-promoting complex subunit cdc27 [Naganishia albida]|nr:anaphase-promoting complex subunit cdc27 [Naganishia albida]
MTSPQSPYHVLRRLLSICYNSPLETASFYANLLHDLFADDLLKGIELDVRCLDLGARYIAEDASLAKKGKAGTTSKGKGKSKPEFNHRTLHNSAAGPSHILPNGLRIADHDIHIKKLKVHSHLVIHLQAWIHIAAKDYYSAIHLVRDKVYRPTTISRKGKEKADGLKGRGANHDTAFLPFDGNREQAERNHHSCLECALIMAEACQQLGRFEEGRSILRNVHEATARANRNLGLSLTFAKPVSFPASSALRLAQLSAQANHERMEKITSTISAAERDKRQPDAIKYFEIALLDDPWLWEAWRGICDFGGHAQALAPFSDENVDLPLLPFPTDLLLGVKDIPELNTNRTSQSGRPHSEDMARSPSIPSSPPEYPSNASSATTATSTSGVRRMSPLPSASPAAKAALLGMTHTAAPPGMDPKTLPRAGSYATPVATTNVEPQPPHQHHIGKRMSRGPPPMQSKSRGYGRRVSLPVADLHLY